MPRTPTHDLIRAQSKATRAASGTKGIGIISVGISECEHPDGLQPGINGEMRSNCILAIDEGEEKRTHPPVFGSEKHRHNRHAGIHSPVRGGPRLG